jgi:hypothetical protein
MCNGPKQTLKSLLTALFGHLPPFDRIGHLDRTLRTFEFGQTTFDMGNSPAEIEDYLRGHGYELRNIVDCDPVFPGRESVKYACFSMHVATL